MPSHTPHKRLFVRPRDLLVVPSDRRLQRPGPCGAAIERLLARGVAIAHLDRVDEAELLVTFPARSRSDRTVAERIRGWAELVGFRRLWLPGQLVVLDSAGRDLGDVRSRCTGCGASFSCAMLPQAGCRAVRSRPLTAEGRAMAQPVFDKQEQFDRIAEGLLTGEQVLFVYDAIGAGTGSIGVTDRRVVVQDNSFVGKKTALTSVPYTRVNAVSFVSDRSMSGKFAISSTIALSAGGQTYEVQFRGDEKARHVHDAVLTRMLGLA